jgi:hypothetical protein
MTVQQPDRNKAAPEPPDSKIFKSDKLQLEPGPNNTMDKFNKALRKILSVPRKDINKK